MYPWQCAKNLFHLNFDEAYEWVPNERTLNFIFKMVSNFFCLEGEVIRLFTCDPFLDTFLCIICTCIQFILFPFCDNLWQNSVKTKIQFLYMYDLFILYWYRPFSRFTTTKHWLENDFFTSTCIFFFYFLLYSHDRTMQDIVYKLVPNLQESKCLAQLQYILAF